MSNVWQIWGQRLSVFSLALLLTACGGGGGGGSSKAGVLVDPEPSYTGVKTQATVTPGNAEALTLGGFSGDNLGMAIGTLSVTGKSVASVSRDNRTLLTLTQAVKQSIRRMELPAKASQRRLAKLSSGSGKIVSRVETFQVYGDSGSITYTLDINDATGSFFGTINYQNYSAGGINISGSADLLGTFDLAQQDFSRFTLSFTSLAMSGDGYSIRLVGTLSWGFNFAAFTETMTVNMVLIDGSDNRTYWFRNYELYTVYAADYVTQTFSGRYYDADHGYVDFTCTEPLIVYSGNSWPSYGILEFRGAGSTVASLSFAADRLMIGVDADGNGSVDWQTQQPTNTLPPVNVPPIADAGFDQSVTQWATVQLDGSGSIDADNDPLTYSWSFESYPQNGYTGLTGANSATPSFAPEVSGTYVVRLTVYDGQSFSQSDTVTITVTPAVGSEPNLLQEQWQYGIYGTGIGQAGLLTSDLDGDGKLEAIAGTYNSFWYIVRQAADGTYEQVWRSERYPVTVARLARADLSGDGRDDIVVGLTDGTVYVYDGPTRQEIRKMTVAASLSDLAVADLDSDGIKEIITSNGIGVFVYAGDGSGLQWSLPIGGGSSIAVGNVDGDTALEIVTTSYGGKGYVIDGVSRVIEWEYINSFGARVGLGDLDGDGMQEVVGASAWYKITVFDADRKTPVWEVATSLDIGSLLLADADADGVPEIIYGDGQWGKIHIIDAQTHADRWTVNNPEHGVLGIAIGDMDGDGVREVLWGADGYLHVANPATGMIEWHNIRVFGPLSAVDVGDVDDDGQDEIVMVSFESDSGYGEGVIHIFNARTHSLEYRENLGVMDWMGVRSVKIGDVDGDGRTEFVVTTGNLYDGFIRVYDGSTHALKRQSSGYSGNYFTSLALADLDNDGKLEIIAGQGREHTGATGTYLIVFDSTTLQEKWRSVDLGSYWGEVYDINVADLDGDGHAEIAASVGGSRLVVYDGVNHDLKLLIEHPSRALTVADVDNDGTLELLAGRTDGRVDVFNGTTFALKATISSFGKTGIDALRITDLDGNGTGEWLLASGGFLSILAGEGQGLKWRSHDLAGNLGWYNHLAVKDTDGDGRKEIVVGSDIALYQFE